MGQTSQPGDILNQIVDNPGMDIHLIRAFLMVANTLSFAQAAKRLGMSQQQLSQQIKRLERDVGFELFTRTTRRVSLTPAGQVLLTDGRALVTVHDRVLDGVRRTARGESGFLRIGYVPTAFFTVLPAVLRSFRTAYPEVALELMELATARQGEVLAQGGLDAGFVLPPVSGDGLEIETIDDMALVAILPTDHRLATHETLTLAALKDEPWILTPRHLRRPLHDRIVAECESAGFRPNVIQEAGEILAVLGLVAGGIGVSVTISCFTSLQRPGIVYRPFSHPTQNFPFAFVRPRGHPNVLVDNLRAIVMDEAARPAGDRNAH